MSEIQTITIHTEDSSGKGRSFSAQLLAHVEAWERPDKTTRPVYMTVACPTAGAAPFQANLRLGRRADAGNSSRASDRFEILRSAGYHYTQQRHPQGVIITAYAPALFDLDPGMVDPSGARFIVLPSREWVDAQNLDTTSAVEHMRRVGCMKGHAGLAGLLPLAALFAAYLDRRSRCPIIPDLHFHLQILMGALDAGMATMTRNDRGYYGRSGSHYVEYGTARVGLAPGVAFSATHETIESFLAEQVTTYYAARDRRARKAS